MEEKEMRICADCGNRLSIDHFRKTKIGKHSYVCNSCITALRRANKRKKIEEMNNRGMGKDDLLDEKEPREVLLLMGRCRRWLESRGYEIKLEGFYIQKRKALFY